MDLQDVTAILIENGYEKLAEFIDINYEFTQKPPPYEENRSIDSITQHWNARGKKNLVLLFTMFFGSITFVLLILQGDVIRFEP